MRAFLGGKLNSFLNVSGHLCEAQLDLALDVLGQHHDVPRDDVGEGPNGVHIVRSDLLQEGLPGVVALLAPRLLFRREADLAAHAVVRANEQLAASLCLGHG